MGSLLWSVAVRTIMMKLVVLACVAALAAAEADADAYYGGFGYPYAYGYVPFGSSSGLDPITQGLDPVTQGYVPYYGYGYHGYYGKRSAEAEADCSPLRSLWLCWSALCWICCLWSLPLRLWSPPLRVWCPLWIQHWSRPHHSGT